MSKANKLPPVTPGEMLLEEFLKPMGISQYRLAKEIGVPAQRIGEIVAGRRAITADTNLRLCRFFGLSEGWWLREVRSTPSARSLSLPEQNQTMVGSGCRRYPRLTTHHGFSNGAPSLPRRQSISMISASKQTSPYPAWLGLTLIAVALIVAPFLVQASLGTYWVRILDLTLLYIMLALGLNIVVGYAGLLDLGYVAFYAVGAYLYALLASPQFGLHLPFWLLLPLGALVAGLFGVLLGAPTLRLRGDYLAIVTLGFDEIIRIFITNLDRPLNITNGPQGINLIDPIAIGTFLACALQSTACKLVLSVSR